MENKLLDAIFRFRESFETIQQITGAYGANLSIKNNLQIQVSEKQLNELCRTFNKIACLEIFQNTEYPYRKHIIVNGVEFFALTKKLEELGEVA
jgi:hypothetical protein